MYWSCAIATDCEYLFPNRNALYELVHNAPHAVYFLQHIDTLLHCSKSNDAASCYILTTIAVVPILNEAAPRDTSVPSSGSALLPARIDTNEQRNGCP